MVDDFFKITLTIIGRIGYIRRRERSIRRDRELFSYREFIIEKNDWRMSEIFIIEIYNSEIGVSRNEDWEYLIRNIVIISLSSVDVELWNRFLKHVDIVVGYRLESIRQTEGETDVIVQSNLEMDKEYQQSSLYFLRVGIFKLQAYTLIFTTYFSYFNTLNFYPHESFTKIEFLYSRDYKSRFQTREQRTRYKSGTPFPSIEKDIACEWANKNFHSIEIIYSRSPRSPWIREILLPGRDLAKASSSAKDGRAERSLEPGKLASFAPRQEIDAPVFPISRPFLPGHSLDPGHPSLNPGGEASEREGCPGPSWCLPALMFSNVQRRHLRPGHG